MINFVYEVFGGGVAVGVADNIEDILESNFYIVNLDELPSSPSETWYIENGEIKVDQQKLIELNRKNMPDLSRIEFKYKLHKAGKLEEVEQFIKTTDNFLLQLAYTEAQFFSRLDPFIDQARIALGLTPEQVDEVWTS